MNESVTTPEPGAARPATPPWIGRVVDERYRVLEKLGEGGMGAVYIAEHLKLRNKVALKVIHGELTGEGEMLARFAREAMATAQLNHPHVASALDYGSLPEGGAYLVMQLVQGKSVREVLDQGALPWPRAAEIGAQIADALHAAHALGIVHRDLKPENVLLEPRDDGSELVKVLDFGIARVPEDGTPAPIGAVPGRALTRVGTIIGTPGYMAPEQALGEPSVDGRADLYSLGVILWEMIAGVRLFAGAGEITEIFTQQLTVTPRGAREAGGDPTLPDELEHLVAQLLSRKREDRPDRAAAVRDALRTVAHSGSLTPGSLSLITGKQTLPSATTSAGRIAVPVGHAATMPLVTASFAAKRKLPVPLLALGCLTPLVVVGIVLAVAVGSGGSDAPPQPTSPGTPPPVSVLPIPFFAPMLHDDDELPPAMQANIDALVTADDRDARRSAATAINSYEHADRLPPFAPLAARLELARHCRDKKPLVIALGSLGDRRALPVLERVAAAPQVRSGFFGLGRSDANACMTHELADALTALGAPPAPH